MTKTIEKNCKHCNSSMTVRLVDHNRGWGNFCDKSCKAKYQTKKTGITGPHYKAIGKTVEQMTSGNYAKSMFSDRNKPSAPKNGIFRNGSRVCCEQCGVWATNGVHTNFETSSGDGIEWTCDKHFDDTHPFSSEALGQW
jgi:hypothetical protein